MSQRRQPQYHHYIPRFVLRRWVSESAAPSGPSAPSGPGPTQGSSPTSPKKGKKSRARRPFKQELINTYDIPSDTLHTATTDLGRTYGIYDMYKDVSAQDVNHVETAFSQLESSAARVISLIEAARAEATSSVELTRGALNTLRKFLFLAAYRNSKRARQFMTNDFDPPTKKSVDEFRARLGLPDTAAVWLSNCKQMLDTEHWNIPQNENIYFVDRMDYGLDMQHSQLGFYAAPPRNEFVLTESGLGLAEGWNVLGGGWLILSRVYPLTPKLAVILRSVLVSAEVTSVPPSYYADLPRSMPDVTYSPPLSRNATAFGHKPQAQWTADDQRRFDEYGKNMLDGAPVNSRHGDRLRFTIHELSMEQADKVNTLLLEHCKETITFRNPDLLLRSIRQYERDRVLPQRPDQRTCYAALKEKLTLPQRRNVAGRSRGGTDEDMEGEEALLSQAFENMLIELGNK